MNKVSVTYKAPPGDSKVTEAFGTTFFDGKAETIEVDDATLKKLQGNPTFEVGDGSHGKRHDPPKEPAKHDHK